MRSVPKNSFTVLDFMEIFRVLYPEDWKMLIERFGLFGSKRRYTIKTYFSNRLDLYSHERNSLLFPFTRYKEAKFRDYRKTTDEEKKVFGSLWIAVYRRAPFFPDATKA